jgi:hypothetical protein
LTTGRPGGQIDDPNKVAVAMVPSFEYFSGRLFVSVVGTTQVNGKPHSTRLGHLGTIRVSQPLAVSERISFWGEFDARWGAIAASHPNISEAHAAELRRKVSQRIPVLRTKDELRQQ